MKYRKITLTAIPTTLLIVYYIFRKNVGFAEYVTTHIARPYRAAIGALCSHVPFSVMELLIAAAVIAVLVYIIRTVSKTRRSKKKGALLWNRFVSLFIVGAWCLTWYCLCFGIEYYAPGFAEKAGLDGGEITVEQLYNVTLYFAENANRLASELDRDESGSLCTRENELISASSDIYGNIKQEFSCLTGSYNLPKKMLSSRLFSLMGFTGIYFPFTGEVNINMDFPVSDRPFTIAHELAHSYGVISEQEANFVGIAACVTSENPIYEYSGYLNGLIYLADALGKADRGLCQNIVNCLNDNVIYDLTESINYWDTAESAVTTAFETVYDGYLKSNGQALGILSYSACVEMLVEYFEK